MKLKVKKLEDVVIGDGYYMIKDVLGTSFLRIKTEEGKETVSRIHIGSNGGHLSASFGIHESFYKDYPEVEVFPTTEEVFCDAIGEIATILENQLLEIEKERLEKSAGHPRFIKPKVTSIYEPAPTV